LVELLVQNDLLLANEEGLSISGDAWNGSDLTTESITDELRAKLNTNELNMFVVVMDISDKFCKLLNPLFILSKHIISDNVHDLLKVILLSSKTGRVSN
jgi:hypothetical protein